MFCHEIRPVRGNRADLFDDPGQDFHDRVHVLLRVVAGEAETDRAVRGGVGYAHGAHHMRRLQASGRAGAAAGGADPVDVHVHQDGLAFDVLEGQVGRVRQTVFHVAVHTDARDGGNQTVVQVVAELADVGVYVYIFVMCSRCLIWCCLLFSCSCVGGGCRVSSIRV